MSERRPSGAPLTDQALIDALSEAARAVAAEEVAAPGRVSLGAGRLERRPAGAMRRWRVGLAVAVAAAAVVVLAPRLLRRATPLTFQVSGGAVERGGYVSGTAGVAATIGQVHFSDGTEIDLLDGESRLSVVAPSAHGARLRLDAGRAHFRVRHLPQAAWSVEAGPYVVQVTGTVFDVRWSSRDELVQVDLHSGSVRVAGPGLSDPVPLRAGQRLSARPAKGEVKIEALADAVPAPASSGDGAGSVSPQAPAALPAVAGREPERAVAPASSPSPARQPRSALAFVAEPRARRAGLPATPPEDLAAVPASPPPVAPPPPTEPPPQAPPALAPAPESGWAHRPWSESVGTGDAAAVVADAERIGVALALAKADSANLAALADAARYQARPELARRALLQQRARFAGTREAQRAAFVLGRMADDGGDPGESMRWYARYLAEAPRGAYADEALGRLMLVIQRRQGAVAAASLAAEYLRRFPNGTYLLQARAIRAGR